MSGCKWRNKNDGLYTSPPLVFNSSTLMVVVLWPRKSLLPYNSFPMPGLPSRYRELIWKRKTFVTNGCICKNKVTSWYLCSSLVRWSWLQERQVVFWASVYARDCGDLMNLQSLRKHSGNCSALAQRVNEWGNFMTQACRTSFLLAMSVLSPQGRLLIMPLI